jgi:acyl-CoA thioester hydrolase
LGEAYTKEDHSMETYRGVVYPWQCDHQGHLNSMHYVGMFDAAFWHQISALGFTRAYLEERNRGFVDVTDTLNYKAEVKVGGLIVIDSSLVCIGGKSITIRFSMRDAETGEMAATSEKVTVYFDLEARRSVSLPDDMRAAMAAHLVGA